ncbi:MAG: CaiB/BaiF CoA-transferase family protein [Woeseiaceae bacterium]
MSGPLAGVRVLDMSRILAGPWAGQLLGDYGADVVKVEKPGAGDDTRRWGPPWLGDGRGGEAAYFLAANRNKRSIAIDLASTEGRRVARALAGRADVLIENFRVGAMARHGLDPARLCEANPGLICCSITAYGQQGSRAQEPGYDAMIQAMGGLMSITGAPDAEGGSPQKVGVAVADLMAGMYAVTAILAALHERSASGKGQRIDVPLYDSQVAWLANQALNFLIGGENPGRLGTAHPNLVPYQVFPTRDGHLMLAVGNDRQFRALAECLGAADLGSDPRFLSNADRVEHREVLVGLISQAFGRDTSAAWLSRLASVGVPAGPINSVAEVLTDVHARERQLVRRLAHPLDDTMPTVANPVRFSRTPVRYDLAPPLLGEQTQGILRDWLDYGEAAIARLTAPGAACNPHTDDEKPDG